MRTTMKLIAAFAAVLTFSACESMPTSFGTAPADAATQSEWTQPRPPDEATRIDGGRLTAEPSVSPQWSAGGSGHTAGLPMMYALSKAREGNAKELAKYIEESLERDPSGNGLIEGSPCTTPRMFAEAIRQYHPGSGLSGFAALPEYVRSLQLRKAPEGEYPMSRVLVRKSGVQGPTECDLDLQGWTRSFSPGEGAWYDPNTGEPVLAGDCSNVVGSPTPKTAACPRGQKIIATAVAMEALPEDLQRRARALVAVEAARNSRGSTDLSAYRGDSVSRYGAQFRAPALPAPVNDTIVVSYRDPKSGEVVEHLGKIVLQGGKGTFTFPPENDPRQYVTQFVWPEYFSSPPSSGREARLLVFPEEWGPCEDDVTGIVYKSTIPPGHRSD